MQGDIFQLESMTLPQVTGLSPKPQLLAMPSKSTSGPQVAIYNEDDLSHLLYVENHRHHHHHHHHHHTHINEQGLFVHPANTDIALFNNTFTNDDDYNDTEPSTPTLSDCESSSSSSCFFGTDLSTPPLPTPTTELQQQQQQFQGGSSSSSDFATLEDADEAIEAYRLKGRRNAICAENFEFPIFLGRQDEEVVFDDDKEEEKWHVASPPQQVVVKTTEEVPMSRHVDAISGPLMSWWPAPMDEEEEHDWGMEVEVEEEKRNDEGGYDVRHVAEIEGPLMSWWPAPLDAMEYEWSGRFYE